MNLHIRVLCHSVQLATAALTVVLSTGCVRNYMVPQKAAVAFYPPTRPAPQPAAHPLVIEIAEASPDYYLLMHAANMGKEMDQHVRKSREFRASYNQGAKNAESVLSMRHANLTLIRYELGEQLRRQFTNAVIVQNFEPRFRTLERYRDWHWWEAVGQTSRSLPQSWSGDLLAKLEPETTAQADLIIRVDLRQGANGEAAAMAGLSFGRYYSVELEAWQNGSRHSQFHSRLDGLGAAERTRSVMEAVLSMPSEKELIALRKKAGKSAHVKDEAWLPVWYSNFESKEKLTEAVALAYYRQSKVQGMPSTGKQVTVDGDKFKTYTADVATAPLLPVYQDLGDALRNIVENGDWQAKRVETLKHWAAYYEKDTVALNQITPAFWTTTGTQPEKVGILKQFHDAELEFAEKLGQMAVIDVAKGEFGNFARNSLLEQNKALKSYQTMQFISGLVAIGGAAGGLAAGAAGGGAQFMEQMKQLSLNITQTATATDKAAGERLGKLIAETVGKVRITINNRLYELEVTSYRELREKLKEIYQQIGTTL